MTKILPFLLIFVFSELLAQTPATNANDNIPTYTTPFRLSVNPGYNGSNWTDETLAELAAGDPSNGIDGAGIKSLRIPLPEDFLETWGYNIRETTFDYYTTLGLLDNTVFLEGPSSAHQDMTEYCTGTPSVVFANLYEPIWDSGNGTPINENNFFAYYIYQTVNIYKDEVKFWEVWNEPDFDFSGNGWKPPGMADNWWENVPDPCDYQLLAPVYYYVRMLRITYEVIKSVDPDAFVVTGGIGFESFLDIILRFTDNPVDGSVDGTNYPYTGGAYFDALSIHSYPDQNGSLRYWDNGCVCWVDNRNSDAAAIGIVDHKNKFETVLFNYGYDDTTYPKKPVIITETHIPNVQLYSSIGSHEAQRNFDMKAIVYAYAHDIRHMALFKLADTEPAATAWDWKQVSGLYQPINVAPFTVIHNESGIATRTTMDLLFGVTTYDATKTAALNLPSNILGGAFDTGAGYIYVLWAKTETDQSETASATYSFPSGVLAAGTTDLDKKEWDFATTGTITTISPNTIALTGTPVFLEEVLSPLPINLIHFDVRRLNEKALLQWSTASEIDNKGFEIQHSLDGMTWEKLSFMAGANNSFQRLDYEFVHESPKEGVNYYRLKQIDLNEDFFYTSIRSVEFEQIKTPAIRIFPNPAKELLRISNFSGNGIIYNLTGQKVFSFLATDASIDYFNIQMLPSGTYQLVLEDEKGKRSNHLLIKH